MSPRPSLIVACKKVAQIFSFILVLSTLLWVILSSNWLQSRHDVPNVYFATTLFTSLPAQQTHSRVFRCYTSRTPYPKCRLGIDTGLTLSHPTPASPSLSGAASLPLLQASKKKAGALGDWETLPSAEKPKRRKAWKRNHQLPVCLDIALGNLARVVSPADGRYKMGVESTRDGRDFEEDAILGRPQNSHFEEGFESHEPRLTEERPLGQSPGGSPDRDFRYHKHADARDDINPRFFVDQLKEIQSLLKREGSLDRKNMDSSPSGSRPPHYPPEEVKPPKIKKSKINSKSLDWKQLTDTVNPRKLKAYADSLNPIFNSRSPFVLYDGDIQKQWIERNKFLPTVKEEASIREAMKDDELLLGWFDLYIFFIRRAEAKEKIWWNQDQYENLLTREKNPTHIKIAIEIGDLMMKLDLPEEEQTSKELKRMRRDFIDILYDSSQSKKPYNQRWGTSGGKKWLKDNFLSSDRESLYGKLIHRMTSLPDCWNKHKYSVLTGHPLHDISWVPRTLIITWLDLGLRPQVMGEFLNILEAYRTPKVKAAYKAAAQASKKQGSDHANPAVYETEGFPKRFIELSKYFALSEEAEKRAALKWISENTYSPYQLNQSLLNIGKYSGKTAFDRTRYSILLAVHWISDKVCQFFQAIMKRCNPYSKFKGN